MRKVQGQVHGVWERNKDSAGMRAMRQDFRSKEDLVELFERYKADGDAIAYVRGLLKSPSAGEIVSTHIASRDVTNFMLQLMSSPDVFTAGRDAIARYDLKEDIRRVGLAKK